MIPASNQLTRSTGSTGNFISTPCRLTQNAGTYSTTSMVAEGFLALNVGEDRDFLETRAPLYPTSVAHAKPSMPHGFREKEQGLGLRVGRPQHRRTPEQEFVTTVTSQSRGTSNAAAILAKPIAHLEPPPAGTQFL